MKRVILVLLLSVITLNGCARNNLEVQSTEKSDYTTVNLTNTESINEEQTEDTEIIETNEESITYSSKKLKKSLSKFSFCSFSQYINNGQDTKLMYTSDVDVSKKLYNIKDIENEAEYWNDYENIKFYSFKDGKLKANEDSIVSLGVQEQDITNCYDLWLALCKDFSLKDKSSGYISDNYAYFTSTSKATENDIKDLEYSKIGNKEVTHVFNINSNKEITTPKSIMITIYYYVNDVEYTVSASLSFDKFANDSLKLPK